MGALRVSDTYHLHCETHDEEIASIQRYSELLGQLWSKREAIIGFIDAWEDVTHFAAEVDWVSRGSDHNFDVSFNELGTWMKKHNDCEVYVYMYGRRVTQCYGFVVCLYGGHHPCVLATNHEGDHVGLRNDAPA